MSPDRQVVVVGAGPAGLVAAIALARLEVHVLVVERRAETSSLARALVVSTRSMEIFRGWDLEDEIRAGAAEVEPLGWAALTLASAEGTEVPLGYPTAAQAAKVSPTRPAWVPQDHLEPLLLGLLRSLPSAEVRFGCELVDAKASHDGVQVSLRMGNSNFEELHAEFVIGADGAHSIVRNLASIRMEGPENLGEFHRVEFRAPLSRIVGERRYGLYLVSNPSVAGVIARRGAGDRWSLSREWTGHGQLRIVDADETQLGELITAASGVPVLGLQIEAVNSFRIAAQLAGHYRQGRLFLVGDAAHRMTPRGGTGMNTAIQDAYDIAWKLGWVLRHWADEEILDSYEGERQPVGRHNVERTAQPDGARQDVQDALPWDLSGRLKHHWIQDGAKALSTLDLPGDGFALLTGPDMPQWSTTTLAPGWRAPLVIHCLDAGTAAALGIEASGARLLRPDGKDAGHWAIFTNPLAPRFEAPCVTSNAEPPLLG